MTIHKSEPEHLPHNIIADLKHDVDTLKKKVTQPDTKSHELILEIESMKEGVHQLNVIFDKALKEMKEEDLGKMFRSLVEKVNTIAVQNETIAKGMLALSDRIDEMTNKQMGRAPLPGMQVQHTIGAPAALGRVAPRPDMSMPQDSTGFPPPPPASGNRKTRVGLF